MLRLSALTQLYVASVLAISCPAGDDYESPFTVPKAIETNCKYCIFSETTDLKVWSCEPEWMYENTIPESEYTNGQVCITGEAIFKNLISKEFADEYKKTIEYLVNERKSLG